MDKRNLARNGQGNCDFKSSNKGMSATTTKIRWLIKINLVFIINILIEDASSKQFPRQRRREENVNKQQQQSNKNRNNNFHDKRPQRKQDGAWGTSSSCETTGLMEADELNSVFNHGSKKQNLNHLLNFHYYNSKETENARAGTFSKHGYHQHHEHTPKSIVSTKNNICKQIVSSLLRLMRMTIALTLYLRTNWLIGIRSWRF